MTGNKIALVFVISIVFAVAIVACGGGDEQNTGPLQHPRYDHTANLLADGKVLLVGGLGTEEIAIGNGEIYDPSTDTWSLTGAMIKARGNHDTTLLLDGRVLAVAGKHSKLRNAGSVEAYDPSSKQWIWLSTDALNRTAHKITLLNNGKSLISGGVPAKRGGIYSSTSGSAGAVVTVETTSVELFEISSGDILEVSPLTHARKEHTSVLLNNGRVLIIGGLTDGTEEAPNVNSLDSTELYDPESDSWSLGAVMSQGRGLHTATTLPDGKILVTGGLNTARQPLNSAELYDPTTDSWAPAASMSQARDGHTDTLLSDGRVLVVGGNGISGGLSLTSAEIYDPSSNSWSSAGNMLDGRSHHTAIQLNDGKVLVAGGLLGPENPLSTVDFYSPSTNSWSSAITNTQ